MMITDVIRHAKSEHVVHFLLTSYFESRAHADLADKLPPALKRLPFAGRHDLAERLRALETASGMSFVLTRHVGVKEPCKLCRATHPTLFRIP